MIVLWLTGTLTLYSAKIYGNVKPHFGGGAPIPIVMYFGAKNAISQSETAEMMLVEETDYGYYVAVPNAETAFFIRRDLVTSLVFKKK